MTAPAITICTGEGMEQETHHGRLDSRCKPLLYLYNPAGLSFKRIAVKALYRLLHRAYEVRLTRHEESVWRRQAASVWVELCTDGEGLFLQVGRSFYVLSWETRGREG